MAEQHLHTNRLIHEKSPYLLQHAHNPVDWYPWGEEAFAYARSQDKPIFLSIGYATCHWCHVMSHESFENVELARSLNETFVNVKIDREELPEIDSLYMDFAQSMMSGSAGWPLNVILTPDLRPIFAVTYLPPHSKHGLMGLDDLIVRIQEIWSSDEREKILTQADKIIEVFASGVHPKGDKLPFRESIEDAAEILFKMADPTYGGMRGAPKFPIGYQSNFLMRYSAKSQDSRALFLVERTLEMMHRGGIYDHLGGGFSRYSVDEHWLVPHFEKMLYDNAFLADAYLEAWQMTKRPLYRQVCEETLRWVLREMTHADGGFYSAEDSDTEGREGYFYTWSRKEVDEILGPDSALFCEFYDIMEEGNFEQRNILNTPISIEEFASKHSREPHELTVHFAQQRKLLWQVREKREQPLKDDKVLTSWNGLMIHALANAGAAFEEPLYLEAAKKAAHFIKTSLWRNEILLHRWRDGQAQFQAGLDDYAFLIRGILTLYETTGETEWLAWAVEMTGIVQQLYKAEKGAFYQTDGRDPNIILRKCPFSDGAEPSGNALHTENLLRLYHMSQEAQYLEQAEDVLKAVQPSIESYAPGYCYHLMNLQYYYDRHAPTIVVALNQKEQFRHELGQLIHQGFIPHKAVVWRKANDQRLFELIPFVYDQHPKESKTTLCICFQGTCKLPLNELPAMIEAIQKL